MSKYISIILVSIILAGCGRGVPYTPDEWVKCNGDPAPKSQGDKIANASLLISSLGLIGKMPEEARPHYRKQGAEGVAACTQALNSGIFDGGKHWVSHTNVLKARAIHHLKDNNPDAALIDLAAIKPVAGKHANNLFYQRSLGLAIIFLEGLAHQAKGDQIAANRAFKKFSDSRPYSRNVQTMAWPHLTEERVKIMSRLVKQDASFVYGHATLLNREKGNEQQAADHWAQLVKGGYNRKSTSRSMSAHNNVEIEQGNTQADAMTLGQAALAAARVNRMDQAHEWINQAKTSLVGSVKQKETKADIMRRLRRGSSKSDENMVMLLEVLVNAYGQYHNGNIDGARHTMTSQGGSFPVMAAAIELIEKLQENLPTEQREGVLKLDVAPIWAKLRANSITLKADRDFYGSLFRRLPTLETKGNVNSYSGKVWFFKDNGFSEEKRKDGSYLIKFTGSTSSRSIVEEMSILRAADLAKKASKSGFIILKLNNYTRTRYTTYNGISTGPGTFAGYMTSIKVVFVDPDNLPEKWSFHKGRIYNANQVWNDLSPIYVKSKNKS